MKARLVLLPSALQPNPQRQYFASVWFNVLPHLHGFIVENARASRRFLRALDPAFPIDSYAWVAQETDGSYDMALIHAGWQAGKAWGLLSDAGYPAVGDPGATVVAAAHAARVGVQVLPGSCSFLMALAGSGLGGQNFAFRGYVPIEAAARKTTLRQWEQESARNNQTQICMDTPYRNGALWGALLQELQAGTKLCFAADLQGEKEHIETRTVAEWRKEVAIKWERVPIVFLFVVN